MAASYQNLRSFQHCRNDIDLVCFQLPAKCPLCGQCTATTGCKIPPYVLPSPIHCSEAVPRAVVFKPTHGDFIRNYERDCNLHIGITDSKGLVCDFNECGLNTKAVWPYCLAVCDVGHQAEWDKALDYICSLHIWSKERYDENKWNCFDFVLYFINVLQRSSSNQDFIPMSREEFTNNYLVNRTKKAERYIQIYRNTLQTGCVMVPKSSKQNKES